MVSQLLMVPEPGLTHGKISYQSLGIRKKTHWMGMSCQRPQGLDGLKEKHPRTKLHPCWLKRTWQHFDLFRDVKKGEKKQHYKKINDAEHLQTHNCLKDSSFNQKLSNPLLLTSITAVFHFRPIFVTWSFSKNINSYHECPFQLVINVTEQILGTCPWAKRNGEGLAFDGLFLVSNDPRTTKYVFHSYTMLNDS